MKDWPADLPSTPRGRKLRWLALFAALILLAIAVWMPRSTTHGPLQLALGLWPGLETLTMAKQRGLVPPRRVKIIDVPWPSVAMPSLRSGVADCGVLTLEQVLLLREAGSDLRVILVLDESRGADVVLAGEGISSPSDLVGKRVGVDPRSSSLRVLAEALAASSLKLSDVEVVPLPPIEADSAITNQQVDALALAEPFATQLARLKTKEIFTSQDLKIPIFRLLVATTDCLSTHRAELAQLINAHFLLRQELQKSLAGPDWDVALRREGMTSEQFAKAWRRIYSFDRKENTEWLADGGKLEAASALAARAMHQVGMLEKLPADSKWLDDSLVREGER